MSREKLIQTAKAVLIAVGIFILISLFVGALFVARGAGSFMLGFWLSFAGCCITTGTLYWAHKSEPGN